MNKSEIILDKLGMYGRMLSGSKLAYSQQHPKSKVFYNANIYDSNAEKLWFGDVDLTADAQALGEISNALGESIYVTREQPYRFEPPYCGGFNRSL